MITLQLDPPLATIVLNDPARRNALGRAMFDALESALKQVENREDIKLILLRGEGGVFCAGFDLAAADDDPALMGEFIVRLSAVNRSLRRSRCLVIAAVQKAAIAGGCALLSACDFEVVSREAKLGYPVHRIGVSPAVTIPTLRQAIGDGAARTLLTGGELIDGVEAHRIGLATHVAESDLTVLDEALALCRSLMAKGAHALAITKAWVNELDGSCDDADFDRSAQASAAIADSAEARHMLANWRQR